VSHLFTVVQHGDPNILARHGEILVFAVQQFVWFHVLLCYQFVGSDNVVDTGHQLQDASCGFVRGY